MLVDMCVWWEENENTELATEQMVSNGQIVIAGLFNALTTKSNIHHRLVVVRTALPAIPPTAAGASADACATVDSITTRRTAIQFSACI
jgi:hypothetical protein